MTKKQWDKHKEVIQWFYEQPEKSVKVWFKNPNDTKWRLTSNPHWSLNSQYVINDEYAGFRKALADGKTLQYYVDCMVGWQDVTNFDNPIKGPENYRIKPEEPRIKASDWVRLINVPEIIKQVDHIVYDTVVLADKSTCLISDWKLWKPKKGEKVWVWNTDFNRPFIATFLCMDGCQYCISEKTSGCSCWECCEPFIGKLPTILKEKND